MGKGSGACERSSIVGILNQASSRSLSDWTTITDIPTLQAALAAHTGLESMVIAEQLRILRGGKKRNWGWRNWSLSATMKDLQQHEGQLGAIFLSEATCDDGIAYLERTRVRKPYSELSEAIFGKRRKKRQDEDYIGSQWKEGKAVWRLHAEYSADNEAQIIQTLLDMGATVVEGELEFPQYESHHTIEGGKALRLKLREGTITYVPHYSVGNFTPHTKYAVGWTPNEEDTKQMLEWLNNWNSDNIASEFYHIVDNDGGTPWIATKNSLRNDYDYLEMIEMLEAQGQATIQMNGMSITKVGDPTTVSPLIKQAEYRQTEEGWIQTEGITITKVSDPAAMTPLIEQAGYRRTEAGWMMEFDATCYEQEAAKIRAMEGVLTMYTTTPTEDTNPASDAYKIMATVDMSAVPKAAEHRLEWLLNQEENTKRISVLKTPIIQQEHGPHNAPMSERGKLTWEGKNPKSGLDALERTGVGKKPITQIPTDVLYGDGPQRGRIHPHLQVYASGEVQPARIHREHKGILPIHGMTGAGSSQAALQRFESMIERGGLQSTAERRRIGLTSMKTLSPIGDIASGIDGGVPCSISRYIHQGSYIAFALKPETLARRDVWFAPCDFGAGSGRYEQFNRYAKRIGQEKMSNPPSDEARKNHYENVVSGPSDNEVYFKHSVPWRDIDTIIVSGLIADQVERIVERGKISGELPQSLRVQSLQTYSQGGLYDANDHIEAIAERASDDLYA